MYMKKTKLNENEYKQYIEQNKQCFYCKRVVPPEGMSRDHFIPKSKGGKQENNIVLCCKPCNVLKSDFTLQEFRDEVIKVIKVVLKQIVDQEFKMTEKQYGTIKRLSVLLKTLGELIEKNFTLLKK